MDPQESLKIVLDACSVRLSNIQKMLNLWGLLLMMPHPIVGEIIWGTKNPKRSPACRQEAKKALRFVGRRVYVPDTNSKEHALIAQIKASLNTSAQDSWLIAMVMAWRNLYPSQRVLVVTFDVDLIRPLLRMNALLTRSDLPEECHKLFEDSLGSSCNPLVRSILLNEAILDKFTFSRLSVMVSSKLGKSVKHDDTPITVCTNRTNPKMPREDIPRTENTGNRTSSRVNQKDHHTISLSNPFEVLGEEDE